MSTSGNNLIDSKQELLELRKYLRPNNIRLRTNNSESNIDKFDKIIQYASDIMRLRGCAEDYFKSHRNIAKSPRLALPLDWQKIKDILQPQEDSPKENFITQIARQNSKDKDIEYVINNLRKVLIRERKNISVSSVQEIDSQCLRWLIKQPGRNIAEKAGIKQKVMAVVRTENYNTLENRVLKELLISLLNHSQRYLQENENKFPNNNVIKAVKSLIKICLVGLNLPIMPSITRLAAIPTPNYVLRQDKHYSKIWKAYQLVLRHTQLIESMWLQKEILYNEIDSLKKYLSKFPNLYLTKFESPIWFKNLPNKEGYFIEEPYLENITNNSLFTLESEDYPNQNNETVIIDLTGISAKHDLLIYNTNRHPNSKPYLQNYTRPSLENIPINWNVSAEEILQDSSFERIEVNNGYSYTLDYILTHENNDLLKDYFEQLYAVKGGKYWIVLIPDCWNAKLQEQIIRAIPLKRQNIYLLWRSVAAVLGTMYKNYSYNDGDSIDVIDFQTGAPNIISTIMMTTSPNGVIPQRKAYSQNNGRYSILSQNSFYPNTVSRERFLFGSSNARIDKSQLLAGLYPLTSSKHIIVLGRGLSTYDQYLILSNHKNKSIVFEEEGAPLAVIGAEYYNQQRQQNKISYYDELEELSIIAQTESEEIKAYILVEANEKFPGGNVYNHDGLIKNSILSLEKGCSIIQFYLCMGKATPNAKLKVLKHKLDENSKPTSKQTLTLTPKMTPGQGLAIVTANIPSLEEPIILDFLENMHDTNVTIASLERDMNRSFPPNLPEVIADSAMWYNVSSSVFDYLNNYQSPDGIWFAEAKNLYSSIKALPPNVSPLEILRRKNVFGNEASHKYPIYDFDFTVLFEKLANDYWNPNTTDKNKDNITRLIAWTYQTSNAIFKKIKLEVLCKISGYANQVCGAPLTQEYTLCANLCSEPEEWEICFNSVLLALRKEVAPANYIRLLYNLLQFHHDFLKKTNACNDRNCWELMVLLTRYCVPSKGKTFQTSSLKAMLYLLRYRRFDGKKFLIKSIQYERYIWIRNIVVQRSQQAKINELRDIFINYLDGAGKIEGLPID